MNRLARRLGTVAAAALVASPALILPATQEAGASVPAISPAAFGMHYLQRGSYPPLPFASAGIWDEGVSWAKIQPNAPTYTPATVVPPAAEKKTDGFDPKAVARLDS